MKAVPSILVCMMLVLVPAGCQQLGRNASKTIDYSDQVKVVIDGNGQFPEELAGRWYDSAKGWQIVFEPDGTISSAVHTIGRVVVRPGQVTTVPMKREGEGVFKAGKWLVQYNPKNRELLVRITLEHYVAQSGHQILEGSSDDVLVGPVSRDGQQWNAEWYSFPEYVVTTDVYDHYKLPVDPNENPRAYLVFKKVTPTE